MMSLSRLQARRANLVGNLVTRLSSTAAASQTKPNKATTAGSGTYKWDTSKHGKNIVLVEGVRTPFTMSSTDYNDLQPYELQRMAIT